MEPVDILIQDTETMKALDELRSRIFTKVASFDVLYAPSKEPVSYIDHERLEYRKIYKGMTWASLYDAAWFKLDVDIPEEVRNKDLIAHIDIGGEGLVYDREKTIDPIGAVTLNTSKIDYYQALVAKTYVDIPIPCPSHLSWDIDAGYNGYYNKLCGHGIFKTADILIQDKEGKDFFYDYLTISCLMCAQNYDEGLRKLLRESIKASYISFSEGRAVLAPLFNGTLDESLTITAVGHSHLDLVWLWPVRETKRKAQRTFTFQLRNIGKYDSYIYGASQPQQFEFIKQNNKELYKRIKEKVLSGNLETQGAMWVEADNNVPSGEALIRQIIIGQRFWRDEFGKTQKICWLPDVFGYNGNLLQILKKCEVPYFLTIKLSWNEHNHFPSRSFVWRGVDSSEILVHMPPAETYNAAASPLCAKATKDNYPELNLCDKALMLYGIGDGGGGPSEVQIEMGLRQKSLANSPKVKFGRAEDFFLELENDRAKLPTYSGELYLEKHQGTYTTQAFNKKANRRCELGLQCVEALYARNDISSYPYDEINELWKRVLFLQFHDILPGSSIHRVYEESRVEYEEILKQINELENRVLESSSKEKYAYNPSPFEREYDIKLDGKWYSAILPPLGSSKLIEKASFDENSNISVSFNEDGSISSFKAFDKEFKKGFLNKLCVYDDPKLHYNAWDIDWEYYKKTPIVLKADSVKDINDGPVRGKRISYKFSKSEITQDVVTNSHSNAIYFHTKVSWHEEDKMLRAEFEPAVFSDEVLCDIQDGVIKRTTKNETLIEKAQFEICFQKWASVNSDGFAFALLNDSKYGLRAKDGVLSLN